MFPSPPQRHFSALLNQWSLSRTLLYLCSNDSKTFELDNLKLWEFFTSRLLLCTWIFFKPHVANYMNEVMHMRISQATLYTHQIKAA